MTQQYSEGSVFSIPLKHGGFALGVLARRPRRGTVVLGYFFGPRRSAGDIVAGVESLQTTSAQLICRFKDTALHRGLWRVVGAVTHWRPEQWPVPIFLRKEGLSGKGTCVEYEGDNLTVPSRETPAGVTDMHHPEDTVLDETRLGEILERMVQEHWHTTTIVDPSQWKG